MALGIDGEAHKAALSAGGKTVAVLPCGLDRFYPSSHHNLARQILEKGGALISEYPEGTEPRRENFIERNRLVSGISDALLVIEAAEKSGTLHTVNFALEQGKTVLAVPGNITSPISKGTNNLIKAGAIPVTDISDILNALDIPDQPEQTELLSAETPEELLILKLLHKGINDSAELLRASNLGTSQFNQALTMLELNGRIRPLGAGHWTSN
jgi:DNA processing protein